LLILIGASDADGSERIMKDVIVARGVGLIAGLGLLGLLLAGLAMMRFAPFAEPDGPKPAPIALIEIETEPPPPPVLDRTQPVRTPRPTPSVPTAPAVPVEIVAAPNPAPLRVIPAPSAPPAPVAAAIETARPLGAPPRPIYPARALQREREGVVVVRLIVETDGDVTSAAIVSEEPAGFGFGAAALAAVRRTKFEPKRDDGAATLGEFTYNVRFRLD
jgi:protein TonB